MKVTDLPINGLKLVEPKSFKDNRGSFIESWNDKSFQAVVPDCNFVQDNQSTSRKLVIRGLHYQLEQPQAKLVRVTRGSVYDVAVDLRRSSPTFGKYFGIVLSSRNNLQLWIPEGFAHGFLALSNQTVFQYKCNNYYFPAAERTLLWNDRALAIEWPIPKNGAPIVSAKDKSGVNLEDAEVFK